MERTCSVPACEIAIDFGMRRIMCTGHRYAGMLVCWYAGMLVCPLPSLEFPAPQSFLKLRLRFIKKF